MSDEFDLDLSGDSPGADIDEEDFEIDGFDADDDETDEEADDDAV